MNAIGRRSGHLAGAFCFLAAQLIALGAGLVLQSVSARNLSAGDYGRFAVTHTMLLVAAHLLCGVLPRAAARQISVRPESLAGVWRSLVRIHLPACAAFSLLLWAVRAPIGALFGDDAMARLTALAACVVVIQCGVQETCWYLLNGLRRHRLQATLIAVHGAVRCAAVYLILSGQATAERAVTGLLIASGVSTALVLPYVLVLVRGSADRSGGPGLSGWEIWEWLKFASFVDLIYYGVAALNLWAVKAYVADERLVAVYAACFVLAQTNLPICRALSRGFFSYLASAWEAGGRPESRRLMASVSRLLLIGLGVEFALAAAVGASFVEWFSGMEVAQPALPAALLFGSGLLGACYVFSELLAAANQLRLRFAVSAFCGLVGVVAIPAAAATEGVVWPAAAFCGLGIVTLGLLVGASRRVFGPWPVLATLARCTAASAGTAGLGSLLPQPAGASGIAVLGCTVAGLFMLALLVLGEFNRDELRALSRLRLWRSGLRPLAEQRFQGTPQCQQHTPVAARE